METDEPLYKVLWLAYVKMWRQMGPYNRYTLAPSRGSTLAYAKMCDLGGNGSTYTLEVETEQPY